MDNQEIKLIFSTSTSLHVGFGIYPYSISHTHTHIDHLIMWRQWQGQTLLWPLNLPLGFNYASHAGLSPTIDSPKLGTLGKKGGGGRGGWRAGSFKSMAHFTSNETPAFSPLPLKSFIFLWNFTFLFHSLVFHPSRFSLCASPDNRRLIYIPHWASLLRVGNSKQFLIGLSCFPAVKT